MFFKTSSRIINLTNVSNINIIKENFRVVFNMNYYVDIHKGKETNKISDYVYWDFLNLEEMNKSLSTLYENKYFMENFLYNGNKCFINTKSISSIKFDSNKNRVIFNLSHPITYTNKNFEKKVTSEFVYSNFKDNEKYKSFVDDVMEKLRRINYEC